MFTCLTKEFIEQQGYKLKQTHDGHIHSFYYHNDLTNNLFIIIWDEQYCNIHISKNNLNQDDIEQTVIYQGVITRNITFMYLMLLCQETPYNGVIHDAEFINNFTKIHYTYKETEFYLICDSVLATAIANEMYEKCNTIIKFRKNYSKRKGWKYVEINDTILNYND
jgi:hypothetical protein